MSYRLTQEEDIIIRLSDNAFIPKDTRNFDYNQYLKWIDEGNTPEPAIIPPEPPDYFTFWNTLIQTGAYSSIRIQSSTSLVMNTAATEFIALIGDAKMGYENRQAIQMSILNVLSSGTFTESDLEDFVYALTCGNLNEIYILQPPE